MTAHRSILLMVVALVIAACGTSESGQAPDPVSSGTEPTSAAGAAALSSDVINPATCEGVLGAPPGTHDLELQSLTDPAQADNQQIESMCAAVYDTSTPGDPFLTVALIKFDSDEPAASHYELLKTVFVTQGIPISEVNSADGGALDRVSALIDRDGIGRTDVLRKGSWILTVSVGPTTDSSLWTTEDIRTIGESIVARAQQ